MKRYIKSTRTEYREDWMGNKIPYQEYVEQDFIVNKSFNVYTEDDIRNDIFPILGHTLEEYQAAGLYKPGKGIVLKVGTRLWYKDVDEYYAYYTLCDYGYLPIAISTLWWPDFRRHVKPETV